MIKSGIQLAEKGYLPDFILKKAINRLLISRLNEISNENNIKSDKKLNFFKELKNSPIAISTNEANEQHYEVPASFFEYVMSKRLKYSCCWYEDDSDDLMQAEINMIEKTISRGEITSNQQILDLGCGWGSFSIHAAQKFPESTFTCVSNSADQIEFIKQEAMKRNLKNVLPQKQDVNDLKFEHKFDRIVSVEMFEHVRNYKMLLSNLKNFMKPEGKLFIHIFNHKDHSYPYEVRGDSDWMSKYFFTGGIMPSADIFEYFNDDFSVAKYWKVNGHHYARTCRHWLENHYKNKTKIINLFNNHYDDANKWYQRWRLFFLACEMLFAYNQGNEWYVSHYLLEQNK